MTNQELTYHVLLIVILLITTLQCLSVFLSVCSLSAVYRTIVSKKQHWRFHFPPGCGSRLVRLLRFPSLRSNPRTPEMRNLRYVTMSALILPTNTIVRHGLLLLCNSAAARTQLKANYFFFLLFCNNIPNSRKTVENFISRHIMILDIQYCWDWILDISSNM